MRTYIIDVHGDGARYSHFALRQDFYSWLIENNISANDLKWDFEEIIKNWENKKIEINSISDELSNNEFNGPSLYEHTSIEVVDEETDEVVFTTALDKKSLDKYQIKTSISDYKSKSLITGTKLIVETGSQGDVYIKYRLETDLDFDPSRLILEAHEIDDDVLIVNVEYDDPNSDINHEDSGEDDKGCRPEYVVVEDGVSPQKSHSFHDDQCTDWFDVTKKPARNGFYEIKKCDDQIESVMLKWTGRRFVYEREGYKFDRRKGEIISTGYFDVEVLDHDIICWRGLKNKHS